MMLSIIRFLRTIYLCHFSKPAENRPIYRAIRRYRTQKIVELGIGDGRGAMRMIELARQSSDEQGVHYVGIDPFEDRAESDGPGLTLKAAHQLLRGAGIRVQLTPGKPAEIIPRIANALGKVDLLVVPAELDDPSHGWFWFFVPRMLHNQSLVFIRKNLDDGRSVFRIKPHEEIERLAAAGARRRAA
jgi:hypothetical protein